MHPRRSGEVLNALMPAAALCVAPSALFWRDRSEDMADLIAAFIEGRDDAAAALLHDVLVRLHGCRRLSGPAGGVHGGADADRSRQKR